MATIKEVAKHAGVSVGTVSNVINGKRVRDKWKAAVESAIRELNFTPHAVARSLKNSKTNNIALILPSLMDTYLAEFIGHSERLLRESGYNVTLYITNNSQEVESSALENVLQKKFDGIILYSCQREDAQQILALESSKLPVVFFERDFSGIECNFAGSDNTEAIRKAIKHLVSEGHLRIALISDMAGRTDITLVEGYKKAIAENNLNYDEQLIRYVESNKENAFKEMFPLLQSAEPPTAVILSSKLMLDGVYEAAELNAISIPEDINVISLSEKTWIKNNRYLASSIERPVEEISKVVCDTLLENIHSPKIHEPQKHYIHSKFEIRNIYNKEKCTPTKRKANEYQSRLKLLLLDSPAANAINSLLPSFKSRYGIDAEIDIMGFNNLYQTVGNELSTQKYEHDVFMIDMPWLPEFAETGSIMDITGEITENGNFKKDNYIEGIFESYCRYKDSIFGLPFMPGTQILFYRKDLFDSKELKDAYRNTYDAELRIPGSWAEYNTVARFFTKEFNSNSPTAYGITMAARYPTFVTGEYCPRKWAYKARAFDEKGRVAINSSEALNALNNFVQSYNYAPPWAVDNDWDGEIDDFCTGKCAMLIQYESHSTKIINRMSRELQGMVGYDIVPGGSPLLGGWSLVINANSPNRDNSMNLIKWACGQEMAFPYSILGGTTAWKAFYMSAGLKLIYPWLGAAYKSYGIARQRSSPFRGGPTIKHQNAYEDILGGEIRKVILKQITPEECLKNAEDRLRELK